LKEAGMSLQAFSCATQLNILKRSMLYL
jgi:hypothetical protein